jgi:hypothetical protein
MGNVLLWSRGRTKGYVGALHTDNAEMDMQRKVGQGLANLNLYAKLRGLRPLRGSAKPM